MHRGQVRKGISRKIKLPVSRRRWSNNMSIFRQPRPEPLPAFILSATIVSFVILISAIASCRNQQAVTTGVTVDYPAEGTVFPPDIVPPTLRWHDAVKDVNSWKISVRRQGGGAHAFLQYGHDELLAQLVSQRKTATMTRPSES